MADKRERVHIEVPRVKQIRLALWGHVRNLSRSEMAERIILDRVSNAENWDEVVKELQIESEIARVPVRQHVANILRSEFKDLAVDEIDWEKLLVTKQSCDPQVAELLESLPDSKKDEAIAFLKELADRES